MIIRKRPFRRRNCPHIHLQGIYGDAINMAGGSRLQCMDCWSFLDGPVALAWVDRDPRKLVVSQNGWFFMKDVGVE